MPDEELDEYRRCGVPDCRQPADTWLEKTWAHVRLWTYPRTPWLAGLASILLVFGWFLNHVAACGFESYGFVALVLGAIFVQGVGLLVLILGPTPHEA